MKRAQLALLAVIAVALIWVAANRDSVAQAPSAAATGSGRYTLNMVPVSAGPSSGYHAILLDTETGRMWSSSNLGTTIQPFKTLPGPMDPRRPGHDQPEAPPRH